jgi:hypothetical protein
LRLTSPISPTATLLVSALTKQQVVWNLSARNTQVCNVISPEQTVLQYKISMQFPGNAPAEIENVIRFTKTINHEDPYHHM